MLVLREWLKDFYGKTIPSVGDIEALFTFHAFEIEETRKEEAHEVIDVKVLPDRGADCYSHRGIARELATLMGTTLARDPFTETHLLEPKTDSISVTIEDSLLCRRFGMALITGVSIQESPEWLKARLIALGQRPINNVVDATNYIMLSLGQPLHAYDGDTFPHADGVWRFGVRRAQTGEKIVTLSNDTYELDSRVQLIVDASNDTPAGIAGIKGGKYAEVTENTTTILLEAANFDPGFTRKASQLLRLQTDASKRFENGISRDVIPAALTDAVALIIDVAGGACVGYSDTYPTKAKNPEVVVAHTHVNALLGLKLSASDIEGILSRLGFASTKTNNGWVVTAPFERTDITIAEDVIAEIGRVYGYEHITSVVPPPVPLVEINSRHYYSEKLRHTLIDLGFSEVITSSFRNKDDIRLANALAADKGHVRSSLSENIRETLDRNMPNLDLLEIDSLRIFEIGTVFDRSADTGIGEHMAVALGVRTKQQGYSASDDVVLKETLAALSASLGVPLDAEIQRGVAEFNVTALLSTLPPATVYTPFKSADVTYRPFSPYPFVTRDIALWVTEGTDVEEVRRVIQQSAGPLCVKIRLFDTFAKDGRVSYAFRLVFQSFERTLTDPEVTSFMGEVNTEVKKQGWEVR